MTSANATHIHSSKHIHYALVATLLVLVAALPTIVPIISFAVWLVLVALIYRNAYRRETFQYVFWLSFWWTALWQLVLARH